jgi:hypothetical protein
MAKFFSNKSGSFPNISTPHVIEYILIVIHFSFGGGASSVGSPSTGGLGFGFSGLGGLGFMNSTFIQKILIHFYFVKFLPVFLAAKVALGRLQSGHPLWQVRLPVVLVLVGQGYF